MKEHLELVSYYLEHNFKFPIIRSILDIPFATIEEYCEVLHLPKVSFLPLEGNLSTFNVFEKLKQKNIEIVQKSISYPLILWIMSIFLTYILAFVLVPGMEGIIQEFGLNTQFINSVLWGSRLVLFLSLVVFALLVMVLILYPIKTHGFIIMIFLLKFRITRMFLTLLFATTMKEYLDKGVPFRNIFQVLRLESHSKYIKWLSYYPDMDLKEGIGFTNLYRQDLFDEKFQVIMKSNQIKGDIQYWLDTYISFTQIEITKSVHRISQLFKGIVITYLVIIIGIFYNIMFIPMQIMEVL